MTGLGCAYRPSPIELPAHPAGNIITLDHQKSIHMKKRLNIAGLACIVILLTSCMSQKIIAPSNANVQLASPTTSLTFKQSQRDWYILWGLVPISHNAADRVIAQNNLKTVRVETVTTPLDFIINIFTSVVTIVSRTEIIEGSTELKK